MAQTKWTHELSIMAEPPSNLPQRQFDSFLIADMLSATGTLSADSAGVFVRGASLSQFGNWIRVNANLSLQNVEYTRQLEDGSVSNRYSPQAPNEVTGGGYHITSRLVPHDMHISGDGSGTMAFTPLEGSFIAVPASGGYGKGLYVTGTAAGTSTARSVEKLGRNGDWRGTVNLLGSKTQLAAGEIPASYAVFGNTHQWRVALRHQMYPAIEKWDGSKWRVIRRIDEAGLVNVNRAGGDFWNIRIRNLGEKLTYDLNGVQGWCGDASLSGQPLAALWDEAPITLHADACRARFDYGEEVLRDENGTLITGEVSRIAHFGSARNGNGKPSSLVRLIEPVATGFQGAGTSQAVTATELVDGVEYVSTLTPNSGGLMSPMLGSVLLAYSPVWIGGGGAAAIQIRDVVSDASFTLAHPPLQRMSEGELEISPALMQQLGSPSMEAALQDFSVVTVKARWKDGAGNAVAGEAGQWAPIFDGIVLGTSSKINMWNGRVLSLKLRDRAALLSDNRGIIDGGAYPLDLLIHRKNQQLRDTIFGNLEDGQYATDDTDFTTDPPTRYISIYNDLNELISKRPVSMQDYAVLDVFGAECVQEILRMSGGPELAASLNGGETGDENEFFNYLIPALRFFPRNHLPLLPFSRLRDGILPISSAFGENTAAGNLTGGKFVFGAKYLDSYLSWIEDFEKTENGRFFWGHINRAAGGRMVPIYAKYSKWMQRCARIWSVDEKVLSSFDHESRPEKNFNRVLVVSNIAGRDAGGMGVGLRSGEARLPASHPNSAQNSCLRTLVVKTNFGFIGGGAEALAVSILNDLPATIPTWPTKTLSAGEGWIFPGDILFGSNLQQSAPALENVMFRAARIAHKFSQNGVTPRGWATTLTLGPLSQSELEAAAANPNGGYVLTK